MKFIKINDRPYLFLSVKTYKIRLEICGANNTITPPNIASLLQHKVQKYDLLDRADSTLDRCTLRSNP
jgi:hypothetical protein